MTSVPGASRYLAAATLATQRGLSPSIPTLLSQDTTTASLLESGRRLSVGGFGLSSSARQLNSTFLNSTRSLGNQILSLAAGSSSSVEAAQTQILAIRARTPENQLAPNLRGQNVDQEA